jgi:hypothetical protein
MVTVQTAVIAFLATGIGAIGIPRLGAVIAIIFFSSSIIIAAWLLAGIPYSSISRGLHTQRHENESERFRCSYWYFALSPP